MVMAALENSLAHGSGFRKEVMLGAIVNSLADLVPDIKSPHTIFTATSAPATTPVLSWVVIACLREIFRF